MGWVGTIIVSFPDHFSPQFFPYGEKWSGNKTSTITGLDYWTGLLDGGLRNALHY